MMILKSLIRGLRILVDVCVLYARVDATEVPLGLETTFAGQYSVWWDKKIATGDYRAAIEHQIKNAGCVVPIWSHGARISPTLHDEVQLAIDHGIPVLPIRIHDVSAPLGFGVLQLTDVLQWTGKESREELIGFGEKVRNVLTLRRSQLVRPQGIDLGNRVTLPSLFFSVSSFQTQLLPNASIEALGVFGAQNILVSAYDLDSSRSSKSMLKGLQRQRRSGSTVLLDSGNYEKDRKGDTTWTVERFHEVLHTETYDVAFSYDNLKPSTNAQKIIKQTIDATNRDQAETTRPILPIVHLPRERDGAYRIDIAPEVMFGVAEKLRPAMIAIPERELGAGIFNRAATMFKIREALKRLNHYQPVHVLGTGNPITIAMLAAAGADSFDGLEWVRYVADNETARLYHFQHYELFQYQAKLAASPITSAAALAPDVAYAAKAAFHNLDFYVRWVDELKVALTDEKRLVEFMTGLLPKGAMIQARESLPGVL